MTSWCYNIREKANRLREVPLEAVLAASGAERDHHDRAKWHTGQGVLSVTGAKFMNWHQALGGGGAIDLVMHLHGLTFKDALDWLSRHFPGYSAQQVPHAQRQQNLRLPNPDARYLAQVRRYLVQDRGLAPSLLEPLIASGRLYADSRANAVFVLLGKGNKAVGAELRSTTHQSWRGMAPGSRKDLGYFSVIAPRATAAVLCESAIDAISCFALHPHWLCVSTAGARADPRWLAALTATVTEVYCGFDSDPTGDAMATAMIHLHPGIHRLRPTLHDWNDVLRSGRDS